MFRGGPVSAAAIGAFLGWVAVGLANVICVATLVEMPTAGVTVRLAHHAVDFGRHLLLGAFSAAAVWAWSTWGPARRARLWGVAAIAFASLALGWLLLSDDLAGIADRNYERLGVPAGLLLIVLVTAVSLTVPAVAFIVPWLGRWWGRLGAAVLAIGLYYLNATVSPDSNPGAHFYLSWLSALLLSATVSPPPGWVETRIGGRLRLVAVLLGISFVWGLVGAAAPVSNSTRIDIGLWHANILPETALRTLLADFAGEGEDEWEVSRAAGPAPPTRHELIGKDGIVIYFSVDAFRADVLTSKKKRRFVPHVWDMAQKGSWFTRAYAPGSATVYSLSALSTGKYFSQLYWTKAPGQQNTWLWEDDSVHFPELLTKAGVFTGHSQGAPWMDEPHRVLRGFKESVFAKTDWHWARGEKLADELNHMLEKHSSGPMFLFGHFLDSHDPYWPGRKRGRNSRARYDHALKYIDDQIGRVMQKVEELGVADRTIAIVASDHGESFGEHGHRGHATDLYEPAIRVPIVIHGARIPKRTYKDLVGVIDLGPTILDLFGLPTPPSFNGQTLVPLLQGKKTTFRRPLMLEAIGLRAMISEDGTKVIHHRKSGVVHVYDLNKDPREEKNLSDDMTPELEKKVERLKAFFNKHTLKKPGYTVPYRK